MTTKSTETTVHVYDSFEITFKQHGLPDSVVSDFDPNIRFKFWIRLI